MTYYHERTMSIASEGEDSGFQEDQEEAFEEKPQSLLKTLFFEYSAGIDIANKSVPSFILEPRSMTERFADIMTHGELLIDAMAITDPIDKMIMLAKWYMSGWHVQLRGIKKPYNPILGEVFRCFWRHSDGSRTWYLAEQVSHHPAVTAFRFQNETHCFSISASVEAKPRFLGNSIQVKLEGGGTMEVWKPGRPAESYVVTFPSVYLRGLFLGKLAMEIAGPTCVVSPTLGLSAFCLMEAKPFLRGKYNQFSGYISESLPNDLVNGRVNVSNHSARRTKLMEVRGDWTGQTEVRDLREQPAIGNGDWFPFVNVRTLPYLRKATAKLHHQEPFESRIVWGNLTPALLARDFTKASQAKADVEVAQRAIAKERHNRKEGWVQRYFHYDSKTKEWKINWIDELRKNQANVKEEERIILTPYNLVDASTLISPPILDHVPKSSEHDQFSEVQPQLPEHLAHPWPMYPS
ncbi:putative Oxysterol-binding protein 4 [Blattamonas nauphoetae]|uniref:Oxysterol-binding protein 4 n=1 Tax=Blattamonas nauphoetae TaxID=2049346 RepID=A0ABQ9YET9_9EUKA|nr:putative Oxysterol-binding protein 4 [Blattamonas nauphoetae]